MQTCALHIELGSLCAPTSPYPGWCARSTSRAAACVAAHVPMCLVLPVVLQPLQPSLVRALSLGVCRLFGMCAMFLAAMNPAPQPASPACRGVPDQGARPCTPRLALPPLLRSCPAFCLGPCGLQSDQDMGLLEWPRQCLLPSG